MRDVIGEQVNHYLHQFYFPKNSDILLCELKKLVIQKDDEFKLDILYIERILQERGLEKDVDQVYKDIAENKVIHKIDFKQLMKGYKAIFLKKNLGISAFSFGGTLIFSAILYFTPSAWSLVNALAGFGLIGVGLYALWILLEPLLTCFVLPLIRYVFDSVGLIIQGVGELFNYMSGSLKRLSFFYDKEKDKPLIEKYSQLTDYDITLIESVFDKKDLTEQQAKIYLNSLLSIKRNISSNLP